MPQQLPHTTPQAAAVHSDTVHSDTVRKWSPRYPAGLPMQHGNDSAIGHLDQMAVMEAPDGRLAENRQTSPLHDTGSMSLLLVSALLILASYRTGYKYIDNFTHNIFSVRKRENLFDEHTVGETHMAFALVLNSCVLEGLLAYYALRAFVPQLTAAMSQHVLPYVAALTGLAAVFYLLQMALYHLLGYTFSDKVNTHLWAGGFRATQSLLGLLLFPVSVVLLVYPSSLHVTLTVAAALYVAARILFICKGFRIFINNFSAILYFILYLCSVEIVPLVILCCGAIRLCENL